MSESEKHLRSLIREVITAYGMGRIDPFKGGPGEMFKLGVDYKTASTNIPHVGQGYVDRSHPLPYEITVRTNQDPRKFYKKVFANDIETNAVSVVPDQVFYGTDGFRIRAHVATGTNAGDKKDAKLIQAELYKYIMSLLSTPKNITLIISVNPVADKIKYFV